MVVQTRNFLESSLQTEPEALLWSGVGGDSFVAQLPSGFNTGVLQQFLPRIDSSTDYAAINTDDYPANCSTMSGAFFVQYSNFSDGLDSGSWAIEACIPKATSPWQSTRKRQDFSESLFLNLTLTQNVSRVGYTVPASPAVGSLYRLTLNTTAGYFELPNYVNGQSAGNLLPGGPDEDTCGSSCAPQYLNI